MIESLLVALYVFVLAMFVGFEVITKVPQMLHTPLMSGSNAISGITLIGAVVVAGRLDSPHGTALGVAAIVFATINVVGGFLVTDRMLEMFRRDRGPVPGAADAAAESVPAGDTGREGGR